MAGENILGRIKDAVHAVTGVVWSFLALGIVLQVLFGPDILFLPIDVIGNITNLVVGLGGAGLAGLVTVVIIYWIYTDNNSEYR